jgi:hypothetical protein
MKNVAIILFVIYLGFARADVDSCCIGTVDPFDDNDMNDLVPTACPPGATDRCVMDRQSGVTNYFCGSDNTTGTYTCGTDNCNCPSHIHDPEYGELKKIMYPVMGVIFGVLWVLLAFIGAALPVSIILIVVGLVDAILGIFLILLPLTTFLGLFYMAVGAFTIAVSRHSWGGDTGIDFLLALTVIVFLLTGGLTFVAFDFGFGDDYVNRIRGYVPFCARDMNLSDGGDRCGNYAYFVTFCVYLLFLIQPIAMIAAAYRRVGHHKDTTVVVTDKHEMEESGK